VRSRRNHGGSQPARLRTQDVPEPVCRDSFRRGRRSHSHRVDSPDPHPIRAPFVEAGGTRARRQQRLAGMADGLEARGCNRRRTQRTRLHGNPGISMDRYQPNLQRSRIAFAHRCERVGRSPPDGWRTRVSLESPLRHSRQSASDSRRAGECSALIHLSRRRVTEHWPSPGVLVVVRTPAWRGARYLAAAAAEGGELSAVGAPRCDAAVEHRPRVDAGGLQNACRDRRAWAGLADRHDRAAV